MAAVIDELDAEMIGWIGRQPVFFVATAPSNGGHVNLSPKGYDAFRVLAPRKVAYLDLTGSGIETIAHLRENGRITIMFCAFVGPPQILRLYGAGTVYEVGTDGFASRAERFPTLAGARAVIEVDIDRISSSCGFAVPFMEVVGERPTLSEWAEKKGDDGVARYQRDKNAASIDGLPGFGS
ncbi:MAG: pyridoxamine 5'-phosphate oxidase family protein [Acidimicrobiia bacterium]